MGANQVGPQKRDLGLGMFLENERLISLHPVPAAHTGRTPMLTANLEIQGALYPKMVNLKGET